MKFLLKIQGFLSREPAMVMATIQAAIGLLASYGFGFTAEQVASIMAVAAVALGWITRDQVTPVSKLGPPPPNRPNKPIGIVQALPFAAILGGCSMFGSDDPVDPAEAYQALVVACNVNDSLPPEHRNHDGACRLIRKVCTDGEVTAPAPALGNELAIDAGVEAK